jgi:serine/threonine protein kinase
VGNGATSVVIQAEDIIKHRKVAIKKVNYVFDHKEYSRRALREIRLQRNLKNHNNVSPSNLVKPIDSGN